ncbi:hypothetical protein BJ165DRAFT_1507796 [Panaeolus papilionaceus]|nr:hypothetical protein BJ165DRAFT_1507796 [Panaeolus papilionaceus]
MGKSWKCTLFYSLLMVSPADNPHPPVRLRVLTTYPNPVVWGFPISQKHLLRGFRNNLTPEVTEEEKIHLFFRYYREYKDSLLRRCSEVYRTPNMSDMYVAPIETKAGPQRYIVAFVTSTGVDNSFLPPQDKIEELTRVADEFGFEWKPNWFRKSTD